MFRPTVPRNVERIIYNHLTSLKRSNTLMGKLRRLPDVVMTTLLIAVLGAIWIAFAPTNLGGQVSYVLVNGISMKPGFHRGDLVIVRQAAEYQPGDVVTYHDAEMGANVIHRIIAVRGEQFILQGDNNSWIDAYQPTSDEIVGKLWVHLPRVGRIVEWVRTPINMAVAVGLLGGWVMLDFIGQKSDKNGNKKKQSARNPAGSIEMALYFFGFLALIFLALSIFAFRQPVLRAADKLQYQQTGEFLYTAAGTPELYDTGFVRSGEPVFTNVTCQLDMGFSYTLKAERLGKIAGFQQFYAIILDDRSGWKRTIPLASPVYFSGNTFINHATLDLCQVQALMESVEQTTGFRQNGYTLDIISQVTVGGSISGQDLIDTLESKLTFKFDRLHFYLTGDSTKGNSLQTVQAGLLSNPDKVKNTYKLFGENLPVEETQLAAIVGLVLSLNGMMGAGFYFYSAAKRDPQTVNNIKYGSILIEVSSHALKKLLPTIDVPTIEDLVKLAESHNTMIMHLTTDLVHYYFAQIEGTTYCYKTSKARAITSGSSPIDWQKT